MKKIERISSKEVYKSNFRQYGHMEKQRWEESEKSRREKIRERVGRKKMQVREKVGKSQFTLFFQWFVVPEGRKVGSPEGRVRGPLAK